MPARNMLVFNAGDDGMQSDVWNATKTVLARQRRENQQLEYPEYEEESIFGDIADESDGEEKKENELPAVNVRTLDSYFKGLKSSAPTTKKAPVRKARATVPMESRISWTKAVAARNARPSRKQEIYDDDDDEGWELDESEEQGESNGVEYVDYDAVEEDNDIEEEEEVYVMPAKTRNLGYGRRPQKSIARIGNRGRVSRPVRTTASLLRQGRKQQRVSIIDRISFAAGQHQRQFQPPRERTIGGRISKPARRGACPWNLPERPAARDWTSVDDREERFEPWLKCCATDNTHIHKGRGFTTGRLRAWE
ncbi:unnamed protein product, partial [Mesorhabditis spiculigera]